MLDRDTGELRLRDSEATIGPGLSRAQCLASALAEGAELGVHNEPWASWKVNVIAADGTPVRIALRFEAEALRLVSLRRVEGDATGADWSSFSEAAERGLEASHEAWLEIQLGEARELDWGTVQSSFDPRSASSTITIRYL